MEESNIHVEMVTPPPPPARASRCESAIADEGALQEVKDELMEEEADAADKADEGALQEVKEELMEEEGATQDVTMEVIEQEADYREPEDVRRERILLEKFEAKQKKLKEMREELDRARYSLVAPRLEQTDDEAPVYQSPFLAASSSSTMDPSSSSIMDPRPPQPKTPPCSMEMVENQVMMEMEMAMKMNKEAIEQKADEADTDIQVEMGDPGANPATSSRPAPPGDPPSLKAFHSVKTSDIDLETQTQPPSKAEVQTPSSSSQAPACNVCQGPCYQIADHFPNLTTPPVPNPVPQLCLRCNA